MLDEKNNQMQEQPEQQKQSPQFSEFGGVEFRKEKPVELAEWYKFEKKKWIYAAVIVAIFLLVCGGIFVLARTQFVSLFD